MPRCRVLRVLTLRQALCLARPVGSLPVEVPGRPLGKVFSFDELERERHDAIGFFEPEDRSDVRMIERREHLRLAAEPCDALGVLRECSGQDLDRDVAVELRVPRPVHLPHATSADWRVDLVWPQTRSACQAHRAGNFRFNASRRGATLAGVLLAVGRSNRGMSAPPLFPELSSPVDDYRDRRPLHFSHDGVDEKALSVTAHDVARSKRRAGRG